MITISICMIVKNEEKILSRCLDTIKDLAEEIIIVDTGSTDKTKEIAAKYTDKIYDFAWIDDFSAARNFAFSKATKEYIYSADADEVLDETNRQRFFWLKQNLLPEIDLVQMKYGNQLQFGSVYNFDEEYRPKLFKRLREFVWEAPIHETVRTQPVIYDSDIIITHMQQESHAGRDLKNFRKQIEKGYRPDKRIHHMYACELYMAGEVSDFCEARAYFEGAVEDIARSSEELQESCVIVAKAARLQQDIAGFFKYTTKLIATEGCSEVCLELGSYYEQIGDLQEATVWYYNACYETEPILDIRSKQEYPLKGLVRCYRSMGLDDQADRFEQELETAASLR